MPPRSASFDFRERERERSAFFVPSFLDRERRGKEREVQTKC